MPIFGKNRKDRDKEEEKNLPEENQPQEEEKQQPEPIPEEQPQPPEISMEAEFVPRAQEPNQPPIKRPTPEGFDFNRYFLAERRIVLENISYETQRPAAGQGQFKLNVKDTIVAQVIGQAGVKCTYNRTLRFDPEGPFVLSVSFAVMLVFNPGTRGEVDWRTIDVAEEFKKNCPALIQTMTAKISLLVAEITNANGGVPIIPMR